MNDIKQLAALTALNEMMRGGHFSICAVDRAADLLGVSCKGSEAYQIMSALHCVDWGRMPEPLREAIPGLLRQCLGVVPQSQFEAVIEMPQPEPKSKGFLHLLRGGR